MNIVILPYYRCGPSSRLAVLLDDVPRHLDLLHLLIAGGQIGGGGVRDDDKGREREARVQRRGNRNAYQRLHFLRTGLLAAAISSGV
jgi:hypothetical protein